LFQASPTSFFQDYTPGCNVAQTRFLRYEFDETRKLARSSATADGPRDVLCQSKSCQLLRHVGVETSHTITTHTHTRTHARTHAHTHTHTHPFNGPSSGTTQHYTTNRQQIEVMELKGYIRSACTKLIALDRRRCNPQTLPSTSSADHSINLP